MAHVIKEEVGATDDVPEAALRWIIANSVTSNVELAKLSNINRRWRRIVKDAVIEIALAEEEEQQQQEEEEEEGRKQMPLLLLLPSMVCRLLDELSDQKQNRSPSRVRPGICSGNNTAPPTSNQTFCAAWFASEGIQEISISSSATAEAEEGADDCSSAVSSTHYNNCQTSVSEQFAPIIIGGGCAGRSSDDGVLIGTSEFPFSLSAESDDEEYDRRSIRSRRRRHGSGRSKSPASLTVHNTGGGGGGGGGNNFADSAAADPGDRGKKDVICADEWRGYRLPMDVLRHFGFAPSFVRDTLGEAVRIRKNVMNEATDRIKEDNYLQQRAAYYQPTFAVRGATVCRPESYCLCLDVSSTADSNVETKLREKTNGQVSEWVDIRLEEYRQSVLRRNRRRCELQRDVLPRVLERDTMHVGRRQRSVQFLNSSGGHAVCMTTPFFGCGPLPEPVTIFCVGIATEDGCFLSGLFKRFELGHLYPNCAAAEATEQSAICIATESWDETESMRRDSLESLPYKFSSDDSSFESSGEHTSSDIKCDCVFRGVNDKLDLISQHDEYHHRHVDSGKRICRGRLGPGSWHCYTAIIDGPSSQLRIDGVQEPISVERKDSRRLHKAMLDGLTVGSDHCFGMSLCCGFGSGGEGEGALAELAVFGGGRLDPEDVEMIERQMMERHCIPPVQTVENRDRLFHEYQRIRDGQVLYSRSPLSEEEEGVGDNNSKVGGIPLRYMARHRLVAWQQHNPVTGKAMKIKKIGCQPGAESSGWD